MIENKEKYNINELLIKLKILCNALIKEKKINNNLFDKLNEKEIILSNKKTEILDLNKQINDLNNKIIIEEQNNKNSKLTKVFHKDVSSLEKVGELQQKKKILKTEIQNLNKNLGDLKEKKEQEQIKNDTKISMKNKEIENLKNEIEKIQIENENSIKQKNYMNLLIDNVSKDNEQFQEKLKEVEKLNEEDEKKLENLMVETEKERKEKFLMENELNKIKQSLEESEKKYKELEDKFNAKNLDKIEFEVFKKEYLNKSIFKKNKKTKITVIFEKTSPKNYFVIFKDEVKNEKINFENLKEFKKIENKNKVKVQYLQDEKEISFVLKIEETLIDYFLETYENFLNAFLEENK